MLTRPNLRYLSDGHPVLNQREIEDYAETLLSAHFPSRLAMPSPLKAGDLMTLINDEDGVVTECDDLGSEGQRKRLGRMYLKRKIIVLDHVLFGERQVSLPFVMAHEVAHWLLHRDCDITAIKEREQFPDDDDETEDIDKSVQGWTALQWLEWQASKLAGALLIPRLAAHNTLVGLQKEMGFSQNRLGAIFENSSTEGRAESTEQIELIAKLFGVSKTVTRIRLSNLGIYKKQDGEPSRVGKVHNPFKSLSALIGSR